MQVDLLLENARVLTLDWRMWRAEFVAICGERIAAVGPMGQLAQLDTRGARRIDCQGMAVVPGFNDAHCHVLALASSLQSVDCRPGVVDSIGSIIKAIRERAALTPPGHTIRANGYDEYYLAERRSPTRWELDWATIAHPVRLDHRTGHAAVLNSAALSLLGITKDTPDPVQGVIGRISDTDEPTGLLMEMEDYLRHLPKAVGDGRAIEAGITEANRLLLSKGITSVQDATPANDPGRNRLFRRFKENGQFTPRVSMMCGSSHVEAFGEEGLRPGDGDDQLRLGAVKVMLTLTTGYPSPPVEEFVDLIFRHHQSGYQVAVHAVEQEAVRLAVEAVAVSQERLPMRDMRHRIEHCCECTPQLARMMGRIKAVAVVQPNFTHLYGERYLARTPENVKPYLYPFRRLAQSGVLLAAGSDAPIARPDPMLSIYSAVTRKMGDGSEFYPLEAVSTHDAVVMHTAAGAYASFDERSKGIIKCGKLADLVVLTDDPTSVQPEAIKDIQVMATVLGGRIVWEA